MSQANTTSSLNNDNDRNQIVNNYVPSLSSLSSSMSNKVKNNQTIAMIALETTINENPPESIDVDYMDNTDDSTKSMPIAKTNHSDNHSSSNRNNHYISSLNDDEFDDYLMMMMMMPAESQRIETGNPNQSIFHH